MSKKIMAAFVAAIMLVMSMFTAVPALAAEPALAPFTIHSYAYLGQTPDIYWVGTSNRSDGKLNGYKFVAPCDITLRLKPDSNTAPNGRLYNSFNIWKDGKKTEMPAWSKNGELKLKAGDEIALEITLYYPEAPGKGNWGNKELPGAIDAKTFEKWYTDRGGVPAYAGGYSTIPKWDSVKTVNIAGLRADLYKDNAGNKSFRFTAPRDMWLTKSATATAINVWIAKTVGDWVEIKPEQQFLLRKGEVLTFEVKEWEKAAILGDVEILTR
jgi:hypothetical protein